MSNYPPGVTGMEYEIAGPDYEHDAQRRCDHCDDLRVGVVQGYRHELWFICDECGETTDIPLDWWDEE